MIYTHFIGRIGKDAQVQDGKFGKYMYLDLAVTDRRGEEEKTTWVRVRSNRSNHINLAKWLTKGKLILVQGVLAEPSIWTSSKDGQQNVQLTVNADTFDFVNTGKRNNANTTTASANNSETPTVINKEEKEPVEETPFPEPTPSSDLPF